MRGRRCVVKDYGKESINEPEISVHNLPTSGCVYFKRKSFVCVHQKNFNPVGHSAVYSVHFTLNVLLKHFLRRVQRNI